MSFPWAVALTYGEAETETSDQGPKLGTVGYTPDGSKFRYCKAGAAINKTWGCVNANEHLSGVSGDSSEAALGTAIAAGDTSFYFLDTNSASDRPVNHYADGYIATMEAESMPRRIKSSTVGNATGITCQLEDSETFATAIANGRTVNVYPSPWGNVQNAGSNDYQAFVCIPTKAITSGYYFWGKVNGPAWVTVYSTWPLAAAGDLTVCFWVDGSLRMLDEVVHTDQKSRQIAGHVLVSGAYGDCLIMLQLE